MGRSVTDLSAARSSESQIRDSSGCGAGVVEAEISVGSEGLVRLGTNWWDLVGTVGRGWGRNKLPEELEEGLSKKERQLNGLKKLFPC